MTERTKRICLITAGVLLCAVVAVGISGRFAAAPKADDPVISGDIVDTKDPIVSIDEPEVKVDIKTDDHEDKDDPGKEAVSSGTEQTIQGTPTKPEASDAPEAPQAPGTVKKEHTAEDVPEADRNAETPPTYEPEQKEMKPQSTEPAGGSTNSSGQVYVPGFGYVTPSGPNEGGTLDDMYENGNKIGIMGG